MNPILRGARFVAERSRNVSLNMEKLRALSRSIAETEGAEHWLSGSPVKLDMLNDELMYNFLFFLHSLNFSYWGDPKWTVGYGKNEYDGSWAMVVCLISQLEKGVPLVDPEYLTMLSLREFARVLAGNVGIPLLRERYGIVKHNAEVLKNRFKGRFKEVVRRSEGDVPRLLSLILDNFETFRDSAVYENRTVPFHKRVQLLISDIYGAVGDEYSSGLEGLENLTAFADYKIPQVLRELGITIYGKDLAERVDDKVPLTSGSAEEVEIRSHTVWAVELISRNIPGLLPVEINDLLWLKGQEKSGAPKPYHRTRTTAY